MMNYKLFLSTILAITVGSLSAYYVPDEGGRDSDNTQNQSEIEFRVDCTPGRSQEDLDINNVRARLRQSGSLFWDASNNARYIVPKVDPASGQEEVSSLFAGGIWLGGLQNENFNTAISTFGINQGNVDFYPGPLDPVDGSVQQSTCADWDKHFVVLGRDIADFLALVSAADILPEGAPDGIPDSPIDPSVIPTGVLGWPARGNSFFQQVHDFSLPLTNQGLAGFFDADQNGLYDPTMGDYPIIEIRDCPSGIFPDMMVFWIFNDNGNTHLESNGNPIRMEVQVQSFAFSTNDEINDMTFYRYKLINRASANIDSMFFANWADPDLGCSDDDYIGCDTTSSVGYVYNADAVDGSVGPSCPAPGGGNVPTYGTSPPMLGIDYFRGPLSPERALDSIVPVDWVNTTSLINVIEVTDLGDGTKRIEGTIQDEFGMSSFIYNSRAGTGCPGPTNDPADAQQAYGFLSGTWSDGTPITRGGNGYNALNPDAEPINYVFPDNPASDDAGNVWSMCCPDASCTPLPDCDFRFIQASGPLTLVPGAVNELIVGVVWISEVPDYPCPNVQTLLEADVAAQGLFDNCFELLDGPEAPDMNIIELDRELILTLNNPDCSNNFNQGYQERDIFSPENIGDSAASYLFEGYTIYQLVNSNVGLNELEDATKSRLIANVDVRNGVSDVYNWQAVRHPNPDSPDVFIPVLRAESSDGGIDNAFQVTDDQFAEGDTRLINHRKYYYIVLAYAYNNYQEFNEELGIGQSRSYLQGRQSSCKRPLQVYTGIPRPLTQEELNAGFGDGALVTRLEGAGVGGRFVEITQETEDAICAGTADGELTYKPGQAPILIEVYNPQEVVDGEFIVRIIDDNLEDNIVAPDATWQLFDLNNNLLFDSTDGISRFNQVLIRDIGFSVSLGQTDDVSDAVGEPGVPRNGDPNLGMIGTEIEYADPGGPNWFGWWPDTDALPGIDPVRPALDYIATGTDQADQDVDVNEVFSQWSQNNPFTPHFIIDYRTTNAYINPIYQNARSRGANRVFDVNNVDIIFTSDTSKWSRCAVVEMFQNYHAQTTFGGSEGDAVGWDARTDFSVGKQDADGDGYADPDGELNQDGERQTGMGWFPGFAIDVESGERLNIFFGENSLYSIDNPNINGGVVDSLFLTGGDLMWNPDNSGTPTLAGILPVPPNADALVNHVSGLHSIFVTNEPYDGCAEIRVLLDNRTDKDDVAKMVRWVSLPFVQQTTELLPYSQGLIPNELRIKLRGQSPFSVVEEEDEQYDGYPTYRFRFENAEPNPIAFTEGNNELQFANVVPNPYYGFSAYETQPQTGAVKITNVPAVATVTIYTLDGKFIRRFDRNESTVLVDDPTAGVTELAINPAIEWDLENFAGIPVTSGVYLIHIEAPCCGEKVLKWFGVKRKFNPTSN